MFILWCDLCLFLYTIISVKYPIISSAAQKRQTEKGERAKVLGNHCLCVPVQVCIELFLNSSVNLKVYFTTKQR